MHRMTDDWHANHVQLQDTNNSVWGMPSQGTGGLKGKCYLGVMSPDNDGLRKATLSKRLQAEQDTTPFPFLACLALFTQDRAKRGNTQRLGGLKSDMLKRPLPM